MPRVKLGLKTIILDDNDDSVSADSESQLLHRGLSLPGGKQVNPRARQQPAQPRSGGLRGSFAEALSQPRDDVSRPDGRLHFPERIPHSGATSAKGALPHGRFL